MVIAVVGAANGKSKDTAGVTVVTVVDSNMDGASIASDVLIHEHDTDNVVDVVAAVDVAIGKPNDTVGIILVAVEASNIDVAGVASGVLKHNFGTENEVATTVAALHIGNGKSNG